MEGQRNESGGDCLKKKKNTQEHPRVNLEAINFLVVDRKQRPKSKYSER